MKTGLILLALAAMTLSGFAQNPAPAPPPPPAPPRAHSITSRVAAKAGWLGVGLAVLTPERAKALKLKDDRGIEITHVHDNSPAAKAGLKENDVVLQVNGQKVEDDEEFARLIRESTPGTKMSLAVWRNGSKENVTATLGSRPVNYYAYSTGPDGMITPMMPFPPEVLDGSVFTGMMGQSPRIGIEGETLDGQLAEYFVKEGVLVRSVVENSPAAKAGLKAGDVIVKVGGTPVSNTREIAGVMRAMHKTAAFTVVRNHKEITLNIEIADNRRIIVPEREVL